MTPEHETTQEQPAAAAAAAAAPVAVQGEPGEAGTQAAAP
ncbi:MAG: hypothetical protein QOJ82_1969, partial [Solirubrobacteraceae bacterium]|nr:hypothetical protein [Solirubrobacteraceae bacterium]